MDIKYYIWSATGADEQTTEVLMDMAIHFAHITSYPKEATARHVVAVYRNYEGSTGGIRTLLDGIYRASAQWLTPPDEMILIWQALQDTPPVVSDGTPK